MSNRIEGAYPTIDYGEVTSRIVMDMEKQEETYICERMMRLNIDKDVLLKQAQEINRLNAELDKYRWIPCSERLPESIDAVNITWVNRNPPEYYEHIKDKEFVGTAHYFNGRWYWYSSTTLDYLKEYGESEWDKMDEDIEVIAWMPLPEPYKKQMKGEADE